MRLLVKTFVLALFVFSSVLFGQKKGNARPNILWVVSEDNTTLLGCYGDPNGRTPNLDKLASEGIQYNNAFANAPVCAPARYTIITGTYASSYGTINMRSKLPIPDSVKFFPSLLRKAGYYVANNHKEDYNTVYDSKEIWDESSPKATWEKRKPGQPFFAVFNFNITHEHVLFKSDSITKTDPAKVSLMPYHPDTKTFRHDYAQYYDRVSQMDKQIGSLLKKLKDQGLYESTIIFYYGDNGGILPGSKRFLNEPGTHVPMIVRIPEKFKYLFDEKRGTKSNRLVSFVDLAPTVLSLCGVKIPSYMQGKAFLGAQKAPPKKYVFMYKQRMDERFDFVRAVRSERFRYVRNFMPFLPRGQHIEYLWRIPSMQEWYALYKAGKLNKMQSRFFEPRPCEELYDLQSDPNGVINVAQDPKYSKALKEMRKALYGWMIKTRDAGFIPEAELVRIAQKTTPREFTKSKIYDVEKFLAETDALNGCNGNTPDEIKKLLRSKNFIERYWALVGALTIKEKVLPLKNEIKTLLTDSYPSVRILAAEVSFKLGEKKEAVAVLKKSLESPEETVRLTAVNSVERLGKGAELFKTELNNLLNDPYRNVVKVAKWTLLKLKKEQK